MAVQKPETSILGHEMTFNYSKTWAGYTLLAVRVVLGWLFFYSGITKVLDPTWSAKGYLAHAVPEGNPFIDVWMSLAGNPVVDILFQWGLTLTGLGLIVGALVRWNAFWAAVMMLSIWASSLPLENGIIVDEHVVYSLTLFSLGVFGAGRILGFDAYLVETPLVKKNSWLRYLLS